MEIKKFSELNEHHLYSKEQQINFIKDFLNDLDESDVEYIYNWMEEKIGPARTNRYEYRTNQEGQTN